MKRQRKEHDYAWKKIYMKYNFYERLHPLVNIINQGVFIMKKDKYSLFDHFYYCILALVVALVIIFMQCLNHTNVSPVNSRFSNTTIKVSP